MKILIYCGYQGEWDSINPSHSNLGGSEKCTLELFHRLQNHGHDVMLVGNGFGLNEERAQEFTEFCDNHAGSHWDAVIAVNYAHVFTYLEEARLTYDNVHFWLHNEEPFFYLKGEEDLGLADVFYDDRLTSVVCVSDVARNAFIEDHPEIEHKVDFIPNGIDIDKTLASYTKDKNTFIYSSCPSRGLDELLDMWPSIVGSVPNAELHICYPSYAQQSFEEYQSHIDQIKGQVGMDSIIVHGALAQQDLYHLMERMEYWLYPSDYFETFCITALEMMAHRVVPIVCHAGNVGQLIAKKGIRLEYTDDIVNLTERFLGAIEFCIENPERVEDQRNKCREFAELLSWDSVVRDWNEFLTTKAPSDVAPVIDRHPQYNRGTIGFTANSQDVEPEETNDTDCPIDAVYIMGMDRTADWNDINTRLDSMNLGPDVAIHRMSAVDGRTITEDSLRDMNVRRYPNWKMPAGSTDNDWWMRDMTYGEVGCALSHLNAWIDAQTHGYQNVLFLEEDFSVNEGFGEFNWKDLPADYDMFFLGRNAFANFDISQVNDSICVPNWHYNAHAYMLTHEAINTIITCNFHENLIPVDEFLMLFWLGNENMPRNDIKEISHADFRVYAIPQNTPDIIGQTSVTGLTSTTEGNGFDKLHPELYSFWEDRDAWIKRFISPGVAQKEWDLLVEQDIPGVLEMPLFTEEFCVKIREEAEHVQNWTTDRHEFYPTTDMILQTIDMHDIYMEVLREFVMPMSQYIWDLAGEGWDNLSSENFLARYLPEAQGHLSLHHDNSDITALVNLSKPGEEFEGGGTYFKQYRKVSMGKQGWVSVHPGRVSHQHGAKPITKGSRYILVSFMTNNSLR